MSVRSSLGVFGAIAVFFVGLFAVAVTAQNSQQTALNSTANQSSEVFNASREVFELAGVGGQSLAWAGIAAFVLIAIGLWITVYRGGR